LRDYSRFDEFLDQLCQDIYPQPSDFGHTIYAKQAIDEMCPTDIIDVLDVGCGVGFCQEIFGQLGHQYTGITLGNDDYLEARKTGKNVYLGDMTYLPWNDNSFDLIFARHVLEHSPFPLLTLMEWRRVSKKYLLLVNPTPEFWSVAGRNHYSVLYKDQLWWLLKRAGWEIVLDQDFMTTNKLYREMYSNNQKRLAKGEPLIEVPGVPKVIEYRLLCKKVEPICE